MPRRTSIVGRELFVMKEFVKIFGYDPDTGVIYRKDKPRYSVGGKQDGYLVIKAYIGNEYFSVRAHRFAWFAVTGTLPVPPLEIDHKDRDRKNNRFLNLREVTRAQNLQNGSGHYDTLSGVKGVTYNARRNTWFVRFYRNGKNYHLGTYKTLVEASQVAAEFLANEASTAGQTASVQPSGNPA